MSAPEAEAIAQLRAPTSKDRQRGAKAIRKIGGGSKAAHAVREALELELRDPRKWEGQYQLIMALGASGGPEDAACLRRVAELPSVPRAVLVAIGDALVHLAVDGGSELRWCLERGLNGLGEGALRATAMRRASVDAPTAAAGLAYGGEHFADIQIAYWTAVAAAGWPKTLCSEYLERCAQDSRHIVARAGLLALEGQYAEAVAVL